MSADAITTTSLPLRSGTRIPQVGLGVFVTTKLWNDDHGYDSTLRAYDKSLERLGLDYVDLYLIHWPVAGKRRETCALCVKHDIILEAYSPLTRGKRLDHPVIRAVAAEVRRTPAQVMVRWGIQHGFVVLPKSVRAERIAENGSVFDFTLDAQQVQRLDALDENLATGWDPAEQP